ncbi:Lactonase, 7-bladed beta-propeller-domain-containing protein [Gongronella butleri]|nr:Lactonase, 7-bladed beta-propeller-domain-containing protein [Gongronella butleri]
MTTVPVYISGYTERSGKGIYLYDFDTTTGALLNGKVVAECAHPTFLAFHPSSQLVICVNETDEFNGDKSTGFVSAYRRDQRSGELQLINSVASHGHNPCYVSIWGHHVLVANYSSGTSSLYLLSCADGLGDALSVIDHSKMGMQATHAVPKRQEAPHAHSIDLDPMERRKAIVMDLGCDSAVMYDYDSRGNNGTGTLAMGMAPADQFKFPEGTGPRHIAFAPNMRSFAYVMGELSNELFMLELDLLNSKFHLVQRISALPPDVKAQPGWLGSEILVHPNGRYLYVTLRGHDSLSVFYIDDRTGKLSFVQNESTRGKHPRHFNFDPTGKFLLVGNQHTDTVSVFSIDATSGKLSFLHIVDHPEPACIQFWT